MPATVSETGTFTCTSLQTGEVRQFHSSEIVEARFGFFGASTVVVVEHDGARWYFSTDDPRGWYCDIAPEARP